VLNLGLPRGNLTLLSTGVLVLYADEESFAFMTPEGHSFAGWITFSAHEQDGVTAAQAQVLIRANDPFYELLFRLGGSKQEDRFWEHTLRALAGYFGIEGMVTTEIACVDPKVQWSRAGNIWYNAAIRSTLYMAGAPVRWLKRAFPSGR
jgi:hypothetical protein